MPPFTVGVTRDFLGADGALSYRDIGLGLIEREPGMRWRWLDERRDAIGADQLDGIDAVLSLAPRWTAASVGERLVAVARFGVGYDMCDVPALSAAGVAVTIAVGATDGPVAGGVLAMMLALTRKLLVKDRLVRSGRWHERAQHQGRELTGSTLGIVGFGGAGRALRELVRPFAMRVLVFDPLLGDAALAERQVERAATLEALFAASDHLSLHCPLTARTRGLVDARLLARMKPTAYLYNAARGPIVVERDLICALAERRIAGAGLDVFEQEPPAADNPLLAFDNVIVTPHAICWTDECFQAIGETAVRSLIAVARGHRPAGLVDPAVWDHPRLRARIAARSPRSPVKEATA
ncbi:MAG TPA: NAD(P)-dependent oxidoreductase [Planctomycetota bacterium]|nr:NAD(P)-dependent oxidoreductase [Planctomycetota bacterium]